MIIYGDTEIRGNLKVPKGENANKITSHLVSTTYLTVDNTHYNSTISTDEAPAWKNKSSGFYTYGTDFTSASLIRPLNNEPYTMLHINRTKGEDASDLFQIASTPSCRLYYRSANSHGWYGTTDENGNPVSAPGTWREIIDSAGGQTINGSLTINGMLTANTIRHRFQYEDKECLVSLPQAYLGAGASQILTTENLNDVKQAGTYVVKTDGNVLLGRNYPRMHSYSNDVADWYGYAGILDTRYLLDTIQEATYETDKKNYALLQTYHPYDMDEYYVRRLSPDWGSYTGVWTSWQLCSPITHPATHSLTGAGNIDMKNLNIGESVIIFLRYDPNTAGIQYLKETHPDYRYNGWLISHAVPNIFYYDHEPLTIDTEGRVLYANNAHGFLFGIVMRVQ